MRRIGFLMGLTLAWLTASSSQAQVRQGEFRLFLDGALFSWTKLVSETEVAGREEATAISIGPLSGGGVGLGYVVSPYLVPELYFSLQHVNTSSGGYTDSNVTQWELRPCLEVPLLPKLRFVPFVVGGMTLSETITLLGLGPAIGAGMHVFLSERSSLDLSLVFRGTFYVKNEAELFGRGADAKEYALLVNLGASFWL